MAVLFRSQYPQEAVYIPNQHRFISFVGGEYQTADADEIAVLAEMYEHDAANLVEAEKPKRGRKAKDA